MGFTLNNLAHNQSAIVKRIKTGVMAAKLIDMGLYPGKKVTLLFKAPLGDPIAIDVEGYTLSLRRNEAALVELE